MGFSAGTMTVLTTVKMSGTIPARGNANANTLPDPTNQPTGGGTQALTYGTSPGTADVFCAGEYTIAAAGTLVLNFYDGGTTASDITTIFGAAANLRTLKSLAVTVIDGGDTSGVTVGGGSNPIAGFFADTSDKSKIFPAGPTLAQGSPAGVAVTSGAKNLLIANNGAAAVAVQVLAAGGSTTTGMWMGFWGFMTY